MNIVPDVLRAFLLLLAFTAGFIAAGCDNNETILDVETPRGGVEIERKTDTGSVEIDVDRDEAK